MSILLKNASFIDWKQLEIKVSNILINKGIDNSISFINSIEDIDHNGCEILDCSGKLVTKSFGIGHHHVYSALARGMPAPKKQPTNFHEILKYIWWNLDKSLDTAMIEASALATAMQCAKNGVTFVIDHHASPYTIEGSLDIIAKAFDTVGISHLLCYEITDRDGPEFTEKGFAETESYLKKKQGLVGLHAGFTISDNTLQKAVDLADKYQSGIHIHVAEDKYDQEYSQKHFNKHVVERLKESGATCFEKSIMIHCLHLNDFERDLIANSDAWIAQNTDSNLKNNVGYFNSSGLGKRIMLGTDGMHSNSLQSIKSSYFTGQGYDTIDFQSAYERLRNVHHYVALNKFEGDGNNNLLILDYDSPTEISESNFTGHLLYGIENRHITDVISNGEFILKNRKVVKVNEKEILEFTKEQSLRLWERMSV